MDIEAEKPSIKWEAIIGIEDIKETLRKEVIGPLNCQGGTSEGKHLKRRSILFYGAAGSGKTYLVLGLGSQVPHYYHCQSSDLISRWTYSSPGELLKKYFEKAIENQPSVFFLDDFDLVYSGIGSKAQLSIITEFHSQLDGIVSREDRVVVIAACCRPWVIDRDVRHRFEQFIYVPLPDQMARVELMKLYLDKVQTCFNPEELVTLGPSSGGMSPADISVYVRDILLQPLRKVQRATHYRKVSGPDPDNPSETVDELFTPCDPNDEGAIEMDWMKVPENRLQEPPITMVDMESLLANVRPSIVEEELMQLQTFIP